MMKRLLGLALAFAVLVAGIAIPQSAHAAEVVDKSYVEGTDQQAFLFNPLVVNQIDIVMTPEAEAALRNDLRTYQPATVTLTTPLGKTRAYAVGVKVKGGWGSFVPLDNKSAFKVKVNYSVPGQTIYGVKKFTLNNMYQDASMLHEAVTYRLFRAMGVPAPRVGYSNVSFNGINYGLHSNIETYDKQMLKRWYPAGTEHLYEGAYGVEVGPELEVDEGSLTDRSDVTELRDWNNSLSGKDWFDAIRTRVDLNEMVMNWAVEHYVMHWDGYTRGWPNNYYIHKAKDGLITMHPWGTDQTWVSWNALIDDGATMMTRCVNYEPCRELYLQALAKIAEKVPSLALPTMVDKIWSKIAPSVMSDPRMPYSYQYAVESKDATKATINSRYLELASFNGTRRSSTLTVRYPTTGFTVRGTIRPTISRTGNGTLSFWRLEGEGVCEVNSTNGSVLILNSGVCQIAAQTNQTQEYHGNMNTYRITVPKLASRIQVDQYSSIRFGKSITLVTTVDSTGQLSLKLKSGSCRVSGKSIRALARSGKCQVTVSVAGDENYLKASKVFTFNLSR